MHVGLKAVKGFYKLKIGPVEMILMLIGLAVTLSHHLDICFLDDFAESLIYKTVEKGAKS